MLECGAASPRSGAVERTLSEHRAIADAIALGNKDYLARPRWVTVSISGVESGLLRASKLVRGLEVTG